MKLNFSFKRFALFRFFIKIKNLFNLREKLNYETTSQLVRSNVDFKSANAWTLVFAIFIASVGLNTNSTAVIIGAMLISPLMGPIVGAGFALGVHDTELLKRCFRNIAYALVISVFTSTLYFLLSPLAEAQSEILARTSPSFFDVLIAFFGGAAGIVAITQNEKGNVVPGVAIATAIIPPLCTVGYGLAKGEMTYLIGALYLFAINALFIAVSTYLFVRYLKFPVVEYSNMAKQRIGRRIGYVATAAVLPSLVTAWYLQRETTFKSNVERYVRNQIRPLGYIIADQQINFTLNDSTVKISIVGENLSTTQIETLRNKSADYGIKPDQIKIEPLSFTKDLEQDLYKKLNQFDKTTTKLWSELEKTNSELSELKEIEALSNKISNESQLLSSNLQQIELAKTQGLDTQNKIQIKIVWKRKPKKSDQTKVEQYVGVRTENKYSCCLSLIEMSPPQK